MNQKKKILVILPRVPWPLEKGDKLRAYHQLKELSGRFDLVVCCLHHEALHPDSFARLQPFCKELYFFKIPMAGLFWNLFKAIFTGIPFQVAWFYNSAVRRKIFDVYKAVQPDSVYCQLLRTAPYTRAMSCRKVLDFQDAFSAGMLRQAEYAKGLKRWLMHIEYHRLLTYESRMFEYFDATSVISLPDRDLLPHPRKDEVVIVPNGIDATWFEAIDGEKDVDVLFTGNMNYPPNVLAAEYLIIKVLPLVKRPIKVMLAGANPHPRVKSLASENVIVTGWVEDMRQCYGRSKVFIAPMLIGTGLQNKLLEAMAMQLPCITSELANKALGAVHEESILVGTRARNHAEHIVRLLDDPDFAASLALNGKRFVKENFSWEGAGKTLAGLFE